MIWPAQLAIALAIFVAGGAAGIKWHAGQDAIAELAAAEVRATEARRQIKAADQDAATHARALANINN